MRPARRRRRMRLAALAAAPLASLAPLAACERGAAPGDRPPPSRAADSAAPAAPPAADPADAAVRRVRARFAAVERALPGYRCRTLELEGFSAEGGELRACFDGDTLRKLTATHFGESGRAQEQLFVRGDSLDFVFRVDERYTALLSGRVAERAEHRFYFAGGRLVRWVGPGGAALPLDTDEARREEAEHLEQLRRLAGCARDRAATTCAA